MRFNKFKGTGVALATPMKEDGSLDFKALEKLVEFNIQGGVEYLVVLGTTGEAITLTTSECREVMDCVLNVNNKRVPIVAGHFGGNETSKLLKRIKDYNFDGIDAILSSNPAYNKPSQEGIFQHYMAIAEASPKPIIIYNVPGRTSSNMAASTTIRLANSSDNFVGIKEASGDLVQASHILKNVPKDFLVLSGDDPTAMLMCALSGHGVISVIGNAYPKQFSDMIRAALRNDFQKARELNDLLLDIHEWLYVEGNPCGIKGALEVKGVLNTRMTRLPLVPCSEKVMDQIRRTINEADLIIQKNTELVSH